VTHPLKITDLAHFQRRAVSAIAELLVLLLLKVNIYFVQLAFLLTVDR